MDCDFSHDPAHLPQFLSAVRDADLVDDSADDQADILLDGHLRPDQVGLGLHPQLRAAGLLPDGLR